MKKTSLEKKQHNSIIAKIISALSLPDTKKCSWMLSGRYVLYLYHAHILKNIIAQPYLKPEIINVIVSDKLYKTISKKDGILINPDNNEIMMPISKDHIVHIISEKHSGYKLEKAEKYENIYIAGINDILTEIQSSLPFIGAKLFEVFSDIDYISKIILFKKAIAQDVVDDDGIPEVVNKLQHEKIYLFE